MEFTARFGLDPVKFLIRKPEIFRKVKEIKDLSGGVVLYAAQSNAQIDAEIAEKSGFRTETILAASLPPGRGHVTRVSVAMEGTT